MEGVQRDATEIRRDIKRQRCLSRALLRAIRAAPSRQPIEDVRQDRQAGAAFCKAEDAVKSLSEDMTGVRRPLPR